MATSSAWSTLLNGESRRVLCHCRIPAQRLRVNKKGANTGRYFYSCEKPLPNRFAPFCCRAQCLPLPSFEFIFAIDLNFFFLLLLLFVPSLQMQVLQMGI
jgi:hypothetical protein